MGWHGHDSRRLLVIMVALARRAWYAGNGRIFVEMARSGWQKVDSSPIIGQMQTTTPMATESAVRARLESRGIGCTAQRLLVGRLLFARDQHVTAEEVRGLLQGVGARVSKATVYNTLNLFADHGLLRALQIDAERTVFDSNTSHHHHLHDLDTGQLVDIAPEEVVFSRLPALPAGRQPAGIEVIIRTRKAAS